MSEIKKLKKYLLKIKSKKVHLSLFLSFFLPFFFLFNNSTTTQYISKDLITWCQFGGDESSIDDLWPLLA
jgi:hypothetical protein